MKCEQIRDLLSPYIDRVTTEEEKRDVEAHIAVCAECRQEVEELSRNRQIALHPDEPRLPDKFLMTSPALTGEQVKYLSRGI